jgi:hypothetical protein
MTIPQHPFRSQW